jgi:hypothetical protein
LTFHCWIVREPPITVHGWPLSAVSQALMSAPLFIVKAPQLLLAVYAHVASGSALMQSTEVGTGVGARVGIGVGTGVGAGVMSAHVCTGVVEEALAVHCCTLPV